MGCCSSKSRTFSRAQSFSSLRPAAQPTLASGPDNNIRHDLLLTIPGCMVHLMDAGEARELVSGNFQVLRISNGNVSLSTVLKVGDELQWPLTKDDPVKKLDGFHYHFSLPTKNDTPLSYGVTFMDTTNLEALDSFLKENSRFTCSPKKEIKGDVDCNADASQVSIPIAANSSSVCKRSSDSDKIVIAEIQETQTIESFGQQHNFGVKEEDINLRPLTDKFKVNINEKSSSSTAWQIYQDKWEQLVSRKDINPSNTLVQTSGKYNRMWMLEGCKPEEVRKWYDFGAIASVYTTAPEFLEISQLPNWIIEAVHESWLNNSQLKQGDTLELKFISAAPEIAGKGFHEAFHFIKLQRPNMVALNKVKATTKETFFMSTITNDGISTRRAWGFWVCLKEMDKVNYPFKIFSSNLNGSFLLNSMTGNSTEFSKSLFENTKLLIWENKLPAIEATGKKACNMMHVGQWHNHICPYCKAQKELLFVTQIRVIHKKLEPES